MIKGLLLELNNVISLIHNKSTDNTKYNTSFQEGKNKNLKDDKLSFAKQKATYHQKTLENRIKKIETQLFTLIPYCSVNNQNIILISKIFNSLSNKDLNSVKDLVTSLEFMNTEKKELKILVPKNIPSELHDELQSDFKELEKCYSSQCYKASTILCGRILEAVLHRKYYETTGFDILEKNPGIGLGTLIAKLTEKEVILDPALKQQIHLINEVRIFSVHKKRQLFQPTKEQTHAMILYTMDIVKKLF